MQSWNEKDRSHDNKITYAGTGCHGLARQYVGDNFATESSIFHVRTLETDDAFRGTCDTMKSCLYNLNEIFGERGEEVSFTTEEGFDLLQDQ